MIAAGSRLSELLAEAGRGLLDLLYPPRCVVCREPGADRFCGTCRSTIIPAEPPVSRRSELEGRACAGAYAGPLRDAVLMLKYHDRRGLARDLGALLAATLDMHRHEWQPDALVPVPIHFRRRRERGYNQSELLAAAVGELCGLPVRAALERVRDTPPQVGMDGMQRRENVRGAFVPCASAALGRRPILIDDVQTSGATLEEAARVLRAAGAQAVFALTVCWQGSD